MLRREQHAARRMLRYLEPFTGVWVGTVTLVGPRPRSDRVIEGSCHIEFAFGGTALLVHRRRRQPGVATGYETDVGLHVVRWHAGRDAYVLDRFDVCGRPRRRLVGHRTTNGIVFAPPGGGGRRTVGYVVSGEQLSMTATVAGMTSRLGRYRRFT